MSEDCKHFLDHPVFQLRIMDFLEFGNILFRANTNIGRLCGDFSNIVGQGIWYDSLKFGIQRVVSELYCCCHESK